MIKIYLKMSYQTIKSKFNRRLKYKEDLRVDFFHSISIYCCKFDKHLKYKKDLGVDSLFSLCFLVYINRQLKSRFFLFCLCFLIYTTYRYLKYKED